MGLAEVGAEASAVLVAVVGAEVAVVVVASADLAVVADSVAVVGDRAGDEGPGDEQRNRRGCLSVKDLGL